MDHIFWSITESFCKGVWWICKNIFLNLFTLQVLFLGPVVMFGTMMALAALMHQTEQQDDWEKFQYAAPEHFQIQFVQNTAPPTSR